MFIRKENIPRGTGYILGISYYSIVIKPILKLLITLCISNDEMMSLFFKESLKKIFRIWLNVEPNNSIKIKQFIDDLLTKNNLHTYGEFQKEIYDQSIERLFRNKNYHQI